VTLNRVAILGFLGSLVYGLVTRSMRMRRGPDFDPIREQVARGERAIFAFFHGQLAMMERPYPEGGPGLSIQVSRSRDGEIVSRALAPYRVQAVRGSSSSGGAASLRALVDALEGGRDLGFACDGPRGPRHVVKSGVVYAAMMSGAPIFPLAACPRWRFVFERSWDRFTIPLPGSEVYYAVGAPIRLDRDADDEALEAARARLEGELRRLTELASQRAGHA